MGKSNIDNSINIEDEKYRKGKTAASYTDHARDPVFSIKIYLENRLSGLKQIIENRTRTALIIWSIHLHGPNAG
jgi:hypothetical protein